MTKYIREYGIVVLWGITWISLAAMSTYLINV